jgi:hypothetical protein
VKDRKSWNNVAQKTNNPCKVLVEEEKEEEEEEEEERLWLNYALSYLLNTFKHNIIY